MLVTNDDDGTLAQEHKPNPNNDSNSSNSINYYIKSL